MTQPRKEERDSPPAHATGAQVPPQVRDEQALWAFVTWAASKGIFPARITHSSLDEELSWHEVMDMWKGERSAT